MIGIIPVGGQATRIGGIPKALLPTPQGTLFEVICTKMRAAGTSGLIIDATHAIKPYLAQYCDDHDALLHFGVPTMSESVIRMGECINHKECVCLGMVDTYFDDVWAFSKLDDAVLEDSADVAVGVFRTRPDQHRKLGMCRIEDGQVVEVVDKPQQTDLEYAWGVLAWNYRFWPLMQTNDPHIGYALPRAIEKGLDVRAVFMDGEYFDCGTPDEYFECINHLTRGRHER